MYPINPNWSFKDAIDGARKTYRHSGLDSKGRRNNYLKAWGNVVGRERAIQLFDEFVAESGSYENAAKALDVSVRTFKELRKYFLGLPSREIQVLGDLQVKMIVNTPFPAEEDRQYEFKEVFGKNPVASIRNTADEYAVAFLNSEGGRILWGVRDIDRMIVGVSVNDQQRDEIRRGVANKIETIRPSIDITSIRIVFHPIYSNDVMIPDLFVIELAVPKGDPQRLYFTGGDEAFVRIDGVKQKLRGPAIQEWIMTHIILNEK
jgi:hypothetical protein